MKAVTWGWLLFGGIGIAFLVISGFTGLHTWRFTHTASAAKGAVTREDYGCAHVRVRFQTQAGEAIEYSQNGEICLHAGQEVKVFYDPSMPAQTATVDSIGALWGTTLWVGVMGAVFLAGALLGLSGSRFVYFKQGR